MHPNRSFFRNGVAVLVAALVLSACSKATTFFDPKGLSRNVVPGIERSSGEEDFVSVVVTGQGLAPERGSEAQKQIMAQRAAIVDAYRNLTERLTGMLLNAYTQQGANTVSSDYIRIQTTTYLRGVQVMGVDYADGVATATVKVELPTSDEYLEKAARDLGIRK